MFGQSTRSTAVQVLLKDERHSRPQRSAQANGSRHLATPPPACQVHGGCGSDEIERQRRRREQPQLGRAVPGPRPSPPLLATSSSSPVWWCCCCCPPPYSGRAARSSRSSSPSMCRAALAAHRQHWRERERKSNIAILQERAACVLEYHWTGVRVVGDAPADHGSADGGGETTWVNRWWWRR